MKCIIIVFTSVLFCLTPALFSQEQSNQPAPTPQLTCEQKADRAVMNSISYMQFGISYAKSLGQSVKQYATYCADKTSPFYQRFRNQTPVDFLQVMNGVLQSDRNFKLEITESSPSVVKGRMTLYGVGFINPMNPFGGVTISECYEFFNLFTQQLLTSIGFQYSYHVNDPWIMFEIHK
jgi:hypothetical protein